MILSWRRRRASKYANRKEFTGETLDMGMEEIVIPSHFRCPITLDLMKDPVTLSTGMTYDRSSIDAWIEKGNKTCPVTNQVLATFDQIPNHALRKMIQDWCVENRSHGVERIPTPRIPVSAYEVTRVYQRIMAATQRGDYNKCLELVAKVRAWGKDSERNKKCMMENRMGCCLSATFEFFAGNEETTLLEEILAVLPWMFPIGEEGQSKLGSAKSLRCLVWFLEGKDLSSRQNAVSVLRKLVSLDQKHVDAIMEIEGAIEALVKIIREGPSVCPTATKASLSCVFYMISGASNEIKSRFVELGLVSLLLEMLVDAEKSLCERALGVLEGLCDCKQGREKAYENALTMPLLVKKMLRVSVLANEFSVSIIWKLCRNQNGDGDGDDEEEIKILMEALQVGAFQKFLVLLQVGCGDGIKDKVTELLKLFNLHISKVDCVDSSMDFKYLKKGQF
ncbi:putative aminoacyltransferase, E1 ubiquitin-activating enzyme [Rosa chinensis]|uniref:U-box domain-containing protein n=1 Tax=Rosa chinensis TaxID=74649 RepID=A0A2P6RGH2_ROSCH|nr:U-box domain-containing protein 21 [Rosa chinensis]PRQ45528.1 putative aminoacyltransferase, E1 ubiquitin-activating enzyme [Rosa chinensis]